MHTTRLLIPTLLLLSTAGCGDKDGPDGDDTATDDSGVVVEDCTNGVDDDGNGAVDCMDVRCVATAACAESNCDDGLDDDGDGAIDCDDGDCADVFHCTWPDSIQHRTLADFTGNSIECRLFGVPYDVDVPNCRTDLNATINVIESGDLCTACDRTYEGPFTAVEDSCSDITNTPTPTVARFGFQFLSPTERVLWAQDPQGVWQQTVTLAFNGAAWEFTTSEVLRDDPDGCDNGTQDLGTLAVTLTFADL